MAGQKAKNLMPVQGSSWEDIYSIDVDDLSAGTRSTFHVEMLQDDTLPKPIARAIYTYSDALTIAEFNNFPAGSSILCTGLTAAALYVKKDATTWKYQAINT